jgi:transposase-like protein
MPVRPCPKCEQPTPKHLEASSKDAQVNYYRCERCGYVWNVRKDHPAGPITPVTIPTQDQTRPESSDRVVGGDG